MEQPTIFGLVGVVGLLALGVVLGFDNFRSSIVLGGLKPTLKQSAITSLIFAIWDGVAPLLGILLGMWVFSGLEAVKEFAEYGEILATLALIAFGVWVIVKALRKPEESPDKDLKAARRWLPLPLAIDNMGAGFILGLYGFSPWVAVPLFFVCTFVLSMIGHQVGKSVASLFPKSRTDLWTGVVLVAVAVVFWFVPIPEIGEDDDDREASTSHSVIVEFDETD